LGPEVRIHRPNGKGGGQKKFAKQSNLARFRQFSLSEIRMKNLARRLGVTRTARITGLDRLGIEVACAVRPLGHILQVSNGKGGTFPRPRPAH